MKYLETRASVTLGRVVAVNFRTENSHTIIEGVFPYNEVGHLDANRKEIFMSRAFSRSLERDANRFLLIDHDPEQMIAETDEALKIKSNSKMLEFRAEVNDPTQRFMSLNDYGVSIGFGAIEGGYIHQRRESGTMTIIRDAELFEISLVKRPVYKSSNAKITLSKSKWL